MQRRRLLQALVASPALAAGAAATGADDIPPVLEGDPDEVLAIWPGAPPGGIPAGLSEEIVERPNDLGLRDRIARGIVAPRVTVFRPRGTPRGALLLLPGGGYRHVVVDKEGFETARWLAARGIAVFVLFYRLPAEGWRDGPDAPLQDAQRALRLVRAKAADWRIDPARIGVIGFSAGGHLAARLAFEFAQPAYEPQDDVDPHSARPAVAALMYPVVAMDGPAAHAGSRDQLLGPSPTPQQLQRYSTDLRVPRDAPPVFLVHAADDASVPLANALRLATALRAASIPLDYHEFAVGGHGFGLRFVAGKPVAAWPDLLLDWLGWSFTAVSSGP